MSDTNPPARQPLDALGGAPDAPIKWWVVVLAWTIPATIATLQSAASYALRDALPREWPWALMQFPRWMVWALITPVVIAANRQFPLRRTGSARAMSVHVGVAVICALVLEVVWLTVTLAVENALYPGSPGRTPALMLNMVTTSILGRLVSDLFIYGAVLGAVTTRDYYRQFRERELHAAQLETQLANAQVQALKMQLHPHFLFNTLHAVNVLIRQDPTIATSVVTKLGDLLRLTLSRATKAEVPFHDELEILQLYLDIERTRFQDRLEIHYNIAPETRNALVPDLILQPIVENAIKHGISGNIGRARVDVIAAREGDMLRLEIRDNGAGMPSGHALKHGVGLATTVARLERLYGRKHELALTNAPGGGTIATIRLPFQDAAVAVGAAQQ